MEKDIFDYIDEEPIKKKRSPGIVWNVLTTLVILSVLCVVVVFLTIYTNPNSSINPYPPPTMPVVMVMPTITPTPRQRLPATWTPEVPPTQVPTQIIEPTATLPPLEEPTATIEGAAPSESDMPFVLHDGNPNYVPNLYHADLGCNWMGIGGQVISLNGAPVIGVVVKLGGQIAGQSLDLVTVSGIATQYGPAGYEFDLTDIVSGPTASSQSMWVQLVDQASLPMSDKIYFDTFEDCDQNTTLIYFKQAR
ncbi:MAG: hypothetical protein IZT55_00465 [Anaerolineae bacterium]|nr:hypothetical protein [Anaerolineae bacterium]